MLQVESILLCTFPENCIQTKHNMQKDTQANPYIPDAGQSQICQQTKIPIPPWKLVPGGSGATSKWSRSTQTSLECATCCAWCDHPRQSCISRCTIHRWCWSQRGGISNSCNSLSISPCSMLELMGSRQFLCRVWLHPSPSLGHTA